MVQARSCRLQMLLLGGAEPCLKSPKISRHVAGEGFRMFVAPLVLDSILSLGFLVRGEVQQPFGSVVDLV